MTKEELSAWALASGWHTIAGQLCLTKPGSPKDAIVRLALKAMVVHLEVRKPAGKWEKVGGGSYAGIGVPADPDALPTGLGLEQVPSITRLMQENRDAMVFSRMGG